jgi:hypothetical protein
MHSVVVLGIELSSALLVLLPEFKLSLDDLACLLFRLPEGLA